MEPSRARISNAIWWATVRDHGWEDPGEPPREWPWIEIPEEEWPDPEDVAIVEDYMPSRRL